MSFSNWLGSVSRRYDPRRMLRLARLKTVMVARRRTLPLERRSHALFLSTGFGRDNARTAVAVRSGRLGRKQTIRRYSDLRAAMAERR